MLVIKSEMKFQRFLYRGTTYTATLMI